MLVSSFTMIFFSTKHSLSFASVVYCFYCVGKVEEQKKMAEADQDFSLGIFSTTCRYPLLLPFDVTGLGGRLRSRRGGQRQTSWRPSQRWRCGPGSSWWRRRRSGAWRPASPPCSPSSSLEATKLKTCLSSGLSMASPLNSSSVDKHACLQVQLYLPLNGSRHESIA